MGILTTCIGAFPKPTYVRVIDWFNADIGANTARATEFYEELLEATKESAESLFRPISTPLPVARSPAMRSGSIGPQPAGLLQPVA